MAHQNRRESVEAVVGEMILLQDRHPQACRNDHAACTGLDLAGQDLEKRRLAGAVRPDQAVTVALSESQRDVLEQDLLAILKRHKGISDQDSRAGCNCGANP